MKKLLVSIAIIAALIFTGSALAEVVQHSGSLGVKGKLGDSRHIWSEGWINDIYIDSVAYADVITVDMTDISTAGSVWVVAPYAGTITTIYSVINGTIATAPAVITVELGGTAVTGASISITHTSSAAGDVDSCTPTALNTVTAGQAIEIITSGASTNTIRATFTIIITR